MRVPRTLGLIVLTSGLALLIAQPPARTSPRIISRTEPSYSDEARRALVNSTAVVEALVGLDGQPSHIRIREGAGFGLDELAIEAVQTWRFEPATTNGQPVVQPANIEVSWRLLDESRRNQAARLKFNLPLGASRPELIKGTIPVNPHKPGDDSIHIGFSVIPDGNIDSLRVLDATNPGWADDALRHLHGWRFRTTNSASTEAVLELTVGDPLHAISAPQRVIPIDPSTPLDLSLLTPILISPADKATFDNYPRLTTVKWEPSPAAASYLVEWDYSDVGGWNAEIQNRPGLGIVAQSTELTFPFIGAQTGRRRVWPVNRKGQRGNPSAWRTFVYKK